MNDTSTAQARFATSRPVQTRGPVFCQQPGYIHTADGASLFYRDWGAGKPLLFLSGWTLDSSMWAYQMQPLSCAGFRCIGYDRRAHGRSSDPGRGYTFDTLAEDLDCVIDSLHLSGVTLIAHSFASGEVVRHLSRYGSRRIDGAVFVAPAAIPFLLKTDDNPQGVAGSRFEELLARFNADFPGWAESQAEAYFAGKASEGMVNATIGMMNRTSHQAMLAMAAIQAATDFRSELLKITVPTLLIHGDCDASAPMELTSIPAAKLLSDARLIIYEGGPHGLYYTHKDRLNLDIERFVHGLERAM
jgi:non-heme chloroperoxidase